jgi:hypothetical protein
MKLAAVISLLFLLSCGSKTAVPKGVIPIAKMTDVLWDVMLADGLISYKYPTITEAGKFDTSVILYQQLARAHGTTQQQLKQSLQFYESRPDLLHIIIDSLQKRSLIPVTAYKSDSVKKRPFKKPTLPPSKLQ